MPFSMPTQLRTCWESRPGTIDHYFSSAVLSLLSVLRFQHGDKRLWIQGVHAEFANFVRLAGAA